MNTIQNIILAQRTFFNAQKTKSVETRLTYLKTLKAEIILNEQAIYEALKLDFKKSEFETFLSEFGLVISALNLTIKNVNSLIKRNSLHRCIKNLGFVFLRLNSHKFD